MLVIIIFLCVILLLTIQIQFKGINKLYLSKENTQVLKGIFIIIVFLSHIKGYAEFDSRGDLIVKIILTYLGQLMVAFFLFASGYGILESVKLKGEKYIQNMPKNRIGKTFFDFSLAILLFLGLDIVIGQRYSGQTIVLAFTGWTSVGNSNWYMFAIFTLYLITFISFLVFSHSIELSIISVSILSLLYIYIMSGVKDTWWSDTYLCYMAGMWYSYFKDKIDRWLRKAGTWGWGIAVVLITAGYIYISFYRYTRLFVHNVVAILFCLVLVFLSMKISFKSRILSWCGKNLFWLYILQRIPMILFEHYGISDINSYLYLTICLAGVIVLTIIMDKLTIFLLKKTWWS